MLYVQDGTIVTGAGSAAGLDAALHLMRQQFGARVAAAAARRMVVPPHRDGGQAQFIARAVPDCDAETLGPLLTWIIENLAEDLGVEALARRSHMSPRTFARRFRDETGTTPHSWVTGQRVQAAEELLEQTDHPVDWIADEVGFGNAAALRHHFARVPRGQPAAVPAHVHRRGSLLGQLVAAYLAGRGAGQLVEERSTSWAAWAARAAHGRTPPARPRPPTPTTAAQTRWPQSSSGTPNTATSSTPGCSRRAFSTSSG